MYCTLRSERGDSRIKNITILAVVFFVLYFGYKFAPPYIDYYRVRNMFAAEANTSQVMPLEYLRDNIMKKIDEIGVPISEDGLSVEREGRIVRIYADYSVLVRFPLGYEVELKFSPYAEKEF